jgi:hypothetical protein
MLPTCTTLLGRKRYKVVAPLRTTTTTTWVMLPQLLAHKPCCTNGTLTILIVVMKGADLLLKL